MANNDIVFSIKPILGAASLEVQTDALALIVGEDDLHRCDWADQGLADWLRPLTESGLFNGKAGQVGVYPTYGLLPVPYVLVSGAGGGTVADHAWREAAAAAAKEAERRGLAKLAVRLTGDSSLKKAALFTEGMILGAYAIRSYRQDAPSASKLKEVTYFAESFSAEESLYEEAIRRAAVIAEATNYARDLTNLPGNLLTPELMADEARKLAARYAFECEILEEQEIVRQGMGGLYHVGKGSVHPPRMIVLKYQGRKSWNRVLGLVGKGITFDTGGISLKKPAGMEEMISDMGGAASLLGAMQAIGELRPEANVLVVIPAAENMPSGGAFKPGDIIPTLSGKTVEVLNTDAEGRIVLGDGVTYALQLGAERIIDVATLTGAILVNFGDVATGALSNNDKFWAELDAAAERTGEKVWRLPAYPEYAEALKSDVADLKNSGFANGWASAITAGMFVGAFAGDTPWIHLDTGGTAWLWSERGLHPKGGTGAMVPTLVEFITSMH